ncbi:copper amine oxidase N-terminal domain-containing protein [Cohnella suwonensis]|uniref:Copper amine oxidase N-terminal domain-containing protein n=1 Tax=Cohnella suwonensis TaxID=696072 RepID=A0ABW0LWR4_9BACL
MKRWVIMALTAVLICVNVSAVSAATQPQPIRVLLNGKAVVFQAPPILIDGKTFVEFRTLFTVLGYTVDYVATTKTVKAKSAERNIEMKLGAVSALVDGNKVPVNGDMKVINGRTMVGVRFIATLSDKNVVWNGAKRTVEITDKGPTAQQKAEVFGLFTKLAAAETAQDADAFLELYNASVREIIEPSIREQFAKFQTNTVYAAMDLESYSSAEAVVVTTEQTRKVKGDGFFADYESDIRYTLRKNASGQWAIDDSELLWYGVLDEESLWKQAVEAPEEDKAAIEGALNSQIKAVNEENVDDYLAVYVPNAPGLAEDIEDLKNVFQNADLKATIDKMAIVEYGNGRAKILASIKVESVAGAQIPPYRSVTEMSLVQQDGKWLFADAESEYDYVSEDL